MAALERCWTSAKANEHRSEDKLIHALYDQAVDVFHQACEGNEQIQISVKPWELFFSEKSVYLNNTPRTSLSAQLFEGGIRLIQFKKGIGSKELFAITRILAVDLQKPEMMDQDLYSLFIELTFDHFEVTGSDLLFEAQKKDPDLKDRLKSYVGRVSNPIAETRENKTRTLRPDDLKILDEFRLNPASFKRPKEEITKVAKILLANREAPSTEREKLERLTFMGFHFLLHSTEENAEKKAVGRDLISRVALMMLEAEQIELFLLLVQKVYQLQSEYSERKEDLEKILDLVLQSKHSPIFARALSSPFRNQILEVLKASPSSSIPLLLLLLGDHPWLAKVVGDKISNEIPKHMKWLSEEARTNPEHPSWESVIHILAQKPTQHFQTFLAVLLSGSSPVARVKLYRQLASIGSVEALKIFDKVLNSEKEEDRIEMLEFLSIHLPKTKPALRMLKAHLESDLFRKASESERLAGYACVAKVAGELSWPFFKSKWKSTGLGIFKNKERNERRRIIVKSLLRSCPSLIEKVLTLTPIEELPEEISELIAKRAHADPQQPGGKSS